MVKRTNNDLQNTTQKTKDRVTWTPLKPGVSAGAPEGNVVPAPLLAPVVFLYYLQNRWQVTNEERTGKFLRKMEHIDCHKWHSSDRKTFKVLTSIYPFRFSCFLFNRNIPSRKSWWEPLGYSICMCCYNVAIYINGKFTTGKLKLSPLSSFVLNRHSL